MFAPDPHRDPRPAIAATLIMLCILACGCADNPPPSDTPAPNPTPAAAKGPAAPAAAVYPTPERAVEALVAAAKSSDTPAMLAIFGPDGREILSSGDAVQDRRARQVFVTAVDQRWKLEETDAARRELVIGNEQWPFPVPLVRQSDGWRFD